MWLTEFYRVGEVGSSSLTIQSGSALRQNTPYDGPQYANNQFALRTENYGVSSTTKVSVRLEFKNSEAAHLGMPLAQDVPAPPRLRRPPSAYLKAG